MKKLLWDISFRIGIEHIDKQHKHLFQISNELMDSQSQQKDEQKVVAALKNLKEYISTHFTDEEATMRSYNYPLLNEHIQKHKDIVISIQETIKKSGSAPILKKNLEELLLSWVSNHILKEDIRFSEWAKANKLL